MTRAIVNICLLASALLASAPARAGFDWGAGCGGGSGSFEQFVPKGQTVTVGTIPAGRTDVHIELHSVTDVDVQLLDEATGDAIIAWPSGLLSGPSEACVSYKAMQICYSGYNGDQTAAGLGNEWIRVKGDTKRPLVMRAFGYAAGGAQVGYGWVATAGCSEDGGGSFAQYIPKGAVTTVGDIPAGLLNVVIELQADAGRDVDVQLYDGGSALVQWPNGQLAGPEEQVLEYKGMTIRWSGYNGIGGNWGHERIEISGRVATRLTMKAYGYQAGVANVTYAWGVGVGTTCLGIATLPCPDGLACKAVQHGVSDPAGTCHTPSWCSMTGTPSEDCGNLMHIMVPGYWTCVHNTCLYKVGILAPGCPYDAVGTTWMSKDKQQCMLIKYACKPYMAPFSSDCGCGCRCPEVIDCSPGAGTPCDLDAIAASCPSSTIQQ